MTPSSQLYVHEVVRLPTNILKRKMDAFSFHFFSGPADSAAYGRFEAHVSTLQCEVDLRIERMPRKKE